ncbi:MAG: hypothetical protein EOM68_14595 [Spirochaetia bacterium]|mgnify:CR=1 FL=1|jgi:replicative DNA helicase|nr:hypothetical protein [Spirochaetia bacterium]
MNTRLQCEIQQALERAHSRGAEAVIAALIEAAATPQDRIEILDVLRTNNLDTPEALYYQFADRYAESLSRQEEAAKKLEIQGKLQDQQKIIAEMLARDGASLADLAKPLADIERLQDDIGRIRDNSRGRILIPATKQEIVQEIKDKPEALKTSYKLGQDEKETLSFQTGAFSIVAAPTGHGKTTLLINLLLDLARQYPTKRHWLFSYEEGRAAIVVKTLNAYCNQDYSLNNKRTIESYYKGDSSFFAMYHDNDNRRMANRLPHFQEKEREFWDLLQNGTINIIAADYPAEELGRVIAEIAGPDTGFVGIDYIQLLSRANRDDYSTRAEELKRICLDLKDLAVEKGLAIVAAAQFNRQVQFPNMMESQGLADASDIEKAANKVIGVWNGDKQPKMKNGEADAFMKGRGIKEGTMYLEVLKARDERSGDYATYEYNGNRGFIGKSLKPEQRTQQATSEKISRADNKAGTGLTRKDLL